MEKISRRNFIKASAVAVAAATSAEAVAASAAQMPEGKATAASSSSNHVTGYSSAGDWLGTAPVIPDSDIGKTIDVDILVLGGGHAGLLAALSASDNGAKVAVVEKQAEKAFEGNRARYGEDIGHVNSKWLIKRGYGPYNTGEIVAEFVKRAAGRCNPDIIRLFVENSGAMFDRLVEVYEEYKDLRKVNDSKVERQNSDGVTQTYDFSNVMSDDMVINQVQKGVNPMDYPIVLGGYKTWPCNAQFMGPVFRKQTRTSASVLRWFQKYHVQKTKDQGTNWYYGAAAVVLTQDSTGGVTGAIVQDAAGKYIKFNAVKGVVLATGDFIGNQDMCWALLNECREWAERAGTTKEQFVQIGLRNGHGHKMACWAGAMIEPSPRGYMSLGAGTDGPWGVGPMLQLNGVAKRFCNEAASPLISQIVLRQPKGSIRLVTDKNYMKSVVIAGLEHGGPNYGRHVYYEDMEEDMKKVLGTDAKGMEVRGCRVAERDGATVYAANTLEELAGYLGYTGDLVKTFVESIKHYNELCQEGADSDYGKDAKAMIPINEPPFYGCIGRMMWGMRPFMVTVAGITADNKLRPLNREGQPIKGLFVCGNTLGGRYGLGYSTPFAGNSIGMAMTHGWMAGKFAAGV